MSDLVERVLKMYHEDFMSLKEIADVFGVSKQYIHYECKKAGYMFPKLPTGGFSLPECRVKEKLEALVKECTGARELSRKIGVAATSIRAWMKIHGIPSSAFKPISQANSLMWNGGYFTCKKGPLKGYVFVSCELIGYWKVNPTYKNRYVPVHKAVVEDHYLDGHILPHKYLVHHIDVDRGNNDPKNLAILTTPEHRTIHGLINHAKGDVLILRRIKGIVTRLHEANLARICILDYLDRDRLFKVTTTNDFQINLDKNYWIRDQDVEVVIDNNSIQLEETMGHPYQSDTSVKIDIF